MLSRGGTAWLLPEVAGAPATACGPLTGWVSAFFLTLFSDWFGDIPAYRLSSLFWFALTTFSLRRAALRFARRNEAQPVAFAFGGEAGSASFSRTVADCAVLLLVATFGTLVRQHEPVSGTALLSLASLGLYGLALTLERPLAGAFLTGLAAGLAAVAASASAGIWMLCSALIVNALARTYPGHRDMRLLALLAGALLPPVLWVGGTLLALPAEGAHWLQAWSAEQAAAFGIGSPSAVLWLTRTASWYFLPVWPLALWGFFSWRRSLDRTQIMIPAVITATGLCAGFFCSQQGAEAVLLITLPALVLAASFGLVTLRQTRENLLDWFAISISTLALLALWLYWFATLAGFPPKMAHSIAVLAPGFRPCFGPGLLLSLLATLCWAVFVVWRVIHRPVVIWRGPWLSAAGTTACVVTLLGLWHGALDINRSYAPPAREIVAAAERLAGEAAPRIEGDDLAPGIRAALTRHGPVHFTRPGEAAALRLVRVRGMGAPEGALSAEITRPHTDESFYLVPGHLR